MEKSKTRDNTSSRLRKRAEQKIQKTPGRGRDLAHLPAEETQRLIHELQVHQVELEMQNDELLKSQRELEQARDKYSDLYDFAPVGYFTVGEKGLIFEVNLTGAAFVGMERSHLIGKPFSHFIARDHQDIFYQHKQRIFSDKTLQSCEIKIQGKNGSVFYAQLKSIAVPDSEGTFNRFRTAVTDISQLKRNEEQIKTSLAEKEVLLKEIHHRVKNNLQLICSLLNLQSRRIDDKKSIDIFEECKGRVTSIALIHEKLYDSENLANINFGQYIRNLIPQVFNSFSSGLSADVLTIDADDVFLNVNKAIPCALIVNELVTNSIKYAFPGDQNREGEIIVRFKSDTISRVTISVADNGVGLPAGFDVNETETLGMLIINALVKQLHGSLQIDRSSGVRFTIQFQNQ